MSDVSFFQWETKTFDAEISGGPEPLVGWKQVIISLGQNKREKIALMLNYGDTSESIEVHEDTDTITVYLNQEQTGQFSPGICDIQFNILYFDKERDASYDETITVLHNMHKKEMV